MLTKCKSLPSNLDYFTCKVPEIRSFYNFDREDETYEVRYEKKFYIASHKLGVELNYKDKSSSVNTYDFDTLKVIFKADF